MDAEPLLAEVGQALLTIGLEAVLIGNAAAALQGAPVTTVDFDFLFRRTPRNLQKLKALATELRGTVLRPYYPASVLDVLEKALEESRRTPPKAAGSRPRE
jgi:hypothetical protein